MPQLDLIPSRQFKKEDVLSINSRASESIIHRPVNQISNRDSILSKNHQRQDHRIVFHSDRVSHAALSHHSSEKMRTEKSIDSIIVRQKQKEPGCPDCSSRVKVSRCSSAGRMTNPYISHRSQNDLVTTKQSQTINDEKRMILDKLNYKNPQDTIRQN